MKNFKKVIASLTSAAMVFGMVSLTPMSSVAAVTLPTIEEGSNDQYVITTNSDTIVLNSATYSNPSVRVMRFEGENVSLDSFSVDSTNKVLTVTNFVADKVDFDGIGWTIVFNGENNTVTTSFIVESYDSSTCLPVSNTLTVSVSESASFVIPENSFIYLNPGDEDHTVSLALDSNTVASKAVTAETRTLTETGPYWDEDLGDWSDGPHPVSYNGVFGPVTFTNKNSSTTSDDEEETTSADETDDSTDGDTTDKTDDATTDDTTSDDTSDDETTTGDSSDNETESPNVIEGKNLSWNTVDSTGKSYWYENGVKQGTVDDPKAVSYDGAVRGREIYDPESMEWYWLDANSNGARAVNKEVFVPYIYQDQGNWTADDIMNNAKLSDGGLNGVGGTVYSAMINKTGKWIRYDAKGAMIKGWYTVEGADAELYPTQKGNTYYYDTKTGTMAKGDCVIDGVLYHFDGLTGALKK